MELIEVKDYEELSVRAANYIMKKVHQNPNTILGLATGGTPIGTYKFLIEDYEKANTSYEQVVTFNLDEYIGLSGDHPQSYRYYMDQHLFHHINIKKEYTFVPNGTAKDPHAECARYEQLLAKVGGVDLQLLGIGKNGHIGFNEPGVEFNSVTHVVDLTPSTRDANARYFASLDEVPKQAITMGISTILKASEILLLVSGEAKRESLKTLLEGDVTEVFPASILKTHPSVTIMADRAALGVRDS